MQKSDDAIDVFCENGLFNSANPSTTGKKLVTEYQNLYSSWEILRHFIFSIKQFLQRYYLEFEILRFTSSLFHTELWGQTCHLPPLAVPRLVLPGEGTDHDMVSQHLKEPEFPDLTWKTSHEASDPAPAVLLSRSTLIPKNHFSHFLSDFPTFPCWKEAHYHLCSCFYTGALLTLNQKKHTIKT